MKLHVLHGVSQQLLFSVALTDEVDSQRCKQQHTTGNILPVGRNLDHGQTGVECLNQKNTQEHAGDGADTANHGNAAQVSCGDGVEVQVGRCGRVAGVHTTSQDDTGKAGEHGGHQISDILDTGGVDTCQTGSFLVATDSKNGAAELGLGQDKAEDDEERAQKINEVGPYNLAMSGAKIIHVSTDYVFDGKGYKPYLEDDETNPVSVYGKTKRAGELAVINNAKIGVVIRTAWLYSAHGGNFVKTMRKLGSERESLNVVADQIGTPTFAGDLAEAIVKIIPQLSEENRGIYHFTNEGVCSWYDFAVEIMDKSMLKCKVNPIPSSQYPTRAVRPFYSVLSKLKIKEVFGVEIKHWKDGLVRCLKQF